MINVVFIDGLIYRYRSIFIYVTLITVQNDIHGAVCAILPISTEDYEVVYVRDGNEREDGI
jgi:hypothetical protein